MVQQTSIQAFHQIQQSGLLSQRRLEVYQAIVFNPKSTGTEILRIAGLQRNHSGRFTELVELGLIKEGQSRECSLTGNTALTWESTGEQPKEVKKKPIKEDRKKRAINKVNEFCKGLYLNGDQVKEYAEIIKLINEV